jgi:molecular chaperone GrpE (heat shock protein)
MIDFEAELNRLLAEETDPVMDELTELAAGGQKLLSAMGRKTEDISLQVEEIYSIIKDADEAEEQAAAAKKREIELAAAMIAMCDILESFTRFAETVPALREQGEAMQAQAGQALARTGLHRIGETGEIVSPKLHNVQSVVESNLPAQSVAKVLQYGYEYGGKILRKAAVVISKGE